MVHSGKAYSGKAYNGKAYKGNASISCLCFKFWLFQASFDAKMIEHNNDIGLLGGMQLFLNLEMVAQSLLPEVTIV